jgi:Flp pilus assembly protein TadD
VPHATVLGALAGHLVEAGWLTAVIVTPVRFTVTTASAFELPKAAALQCVALVVLAGWAANAAERRHSREHGARGRSGVRALPQPAAGLAFLVLAASAVATATSIAPRPSLWGSYERWQGLATTAAYVVLFLSVLARLRTAAQLDRLVAATLIASLPVALYAVVQHAGGDPADWSARTASRVSSTLGNPIFLGGYLAMVIPLTVCRLVEAWPARPSPAGRGARVALGGVVMASLGLQIAAWWAGFLAGSLAALAAAGLWSADALAAGNAPGRQLRFAGYGVLVSVQLAAVFMSRSRGPLLGLAASLLLLALLDAVRHARWRRATLVAGSGVIAAAMGLLVLAGSSPGAPWLGRGEVALEGTTRVRLLIWDRMWPLVTGTPLRALLGHGPETLGLAFEPHLQPELGRLIGRRDAATRVVVDRAHNDTWDAIATVGFTGLGIGLLLLTAVVAAGLTATGLVCSAAERRAFVACWWGGAVATAVLARLADGSWRLLGPALPLGMLAGLLAQLASTGWRGLRGAPGPPATREASRRLIECGLLAAIAAHVVETQVGIAVTATRTVFWVLAAALVAAGRAATAETVPPTASPGPPATAARDAAVPFILGAVAAITLLDAFRADSHSVADGSAMGAITHVGWPVLAAVGVAAALGCGRRRPGQPLARAAGIATAGLAVVVGALALRPTIDTVRADVLHRTARIRLERAGQPGAAIPPAREATRVDPGQPAHHQLLARALFEHAQHAESPPAGDALFAEADASLGRARALSPRSVDHVVAHAQLLRVWAQRTPDPVQRAARLETALALSEDATRRAPGDVTLWSDRGAALLAAGRTSDARGALLRALALDLGHAPAFQSLGDLHAARGQPDAALRAYRAAVAREAPTDHAAQRALAEIHRARGRLARALAHAERALALGPPAERPALQALVDALGAALTGGTGRPARGDD